MRLLRLVPIILIAALTQGCVSTAVSGAVSGAQLAYGHSTIQKDVSDSYITMQAYRKLYGDTHQFDDSNITVSTFNQEILLTGQITTAEQRTNVENLVKQIDGVETVYNHIETAPPISTLSRVSDSWITTKIKTHLVAMNDVDPSKIKVITENGTVYLMGVVLPSQAGIAEDIAKDTSGVQNVVKLFTYLRISKV